MDQKKIVVYMCSFLSIIDILDTIIDILDTIHYWYHCKILFHLTPFITPIYVILRYWLGLSLAIPAEIVSFFSGSSYILIRNHEFWYIFNLLRGLKSFGTYISGRFRFVDVKKLSEELIKHIWASLYELFWFHIWQERKWAT